MTRDGEPIVPHGPPVSPEELIEQAFALMDLHPPVPTRWDGNYDDHIAALRVSLAEVERLREENERLQRDNAAILVQLQQWDDLQERAIKGLLDMLDEPLNSGDGSYRP